MKSNWVILVSPESKVGSVVGVDRDEVGDEVRELHAAAVGRVSAPLELDLDVAAVGEARRLAADGQRRDPANALLDARHGAPGARHRCVAHVDVALHRQRQRQPDGRGVEQRRDHLVHRVPAHRKHNKAEKLFWYTRRWVLK